MEFPGLGEHCSDASCNRLDFLPMKCDVCHRNFCGEHFRYQNHGCEGATKKDVQVPTCPLCGAPVPGKRGEAPDIAVSAHIDDDCQADPAKQRRNKIFTNRCRFKGCKGKEMVPLVCSECTLNFCFKHRHTADHKCEGKMAAIRNRALDAALGRRNNIDNAKKPSSTTPSNSNRNATNVFSEVQGNMSEDEALARALSLSMQDEHALQNASQRSPLNRLPFNRQHVGGENSNGRCIVS